MVKGFIWCNRPSNSAKNLADRIGLKRIRKSNSKFRGGAHKVVVNWGCSHAPEAVQDSSMINPTHLVARMSNKLTFFRWMQEEFVLGDYKPYPEFTEDMNVARDWIDQGHKVVCRRILNGHSGAGITVASTIDELVPVPLYTKYMPKDKEWRVHVFVQVLEQDYDNFCDVQLKVKRKDFEGEYNRLVRNHQNGYIYQRNDINEPDGLVELATEVLLVSGLDFGAVDIIQRGNKFYVLEVNTAPGLEGTTLEVYTNQIRKMIEGYNF